MAPIVMLMQSFLLREIGIFINFVNIVGAEERPKQAHKFHTLEFDIFLDVLMVLQSMLLLSLFCTLSILTVAFLSTVNETLYFEMSMMDWFVQLFQIDGRMVSPHPFSPLKTECLIDPPFFLSKKLSPSSTFPEFPYPSILFPPLKLL